jgi:hypothetical protein
MQRSHSFQALTNLFSKEIFGFAVYIQFSSIITVVCISENISAPSLYTVGGGRNDEIATTSIFGNSYVTYKETLIQPSISNRTSHSTWVLCWMLT